MKRYGYHRTSTREQHLDRGIKKITAYCEQNNLELEKIFTDQQTGKNFNRPRYQVLKEDVLRVGDELIITEVDRLGRNKQETLKKLQYYRDNGIRVKILELPTTLMDLSKLDNAMARMLMETINNMLIELYAAMAQAEIEKKEKRQREGIDSKKARGEWDDYGRPAVMPIDEFSEHYQKVVSGEIRVIHRLNGGPSAARNAGLAIAKGKYIGYVDGDDWIEPEMYRKMYDACEQNGAQMAICSYRQWGEGAEKMNPTGNVLVLSKMEAMELYIMGDKQYHI